MTYTIPVMKWDIEEGRSSDIFIFRQRIKKFRDRIKAVKEQIMAFITSVRIRIRVPRKNKGKKALELIMGVALCNSR